MAQAINAKNAKEEVAMRMVEEVWNDQQFDVLDEVMPEDYVSHLPGIEPIHGIEAYKEQVQNYHSAFPDFHVEITDLFSSDDRVAMRYVMTGTNEGPLEGRTMDIPATGKSIEVDGIAVAMFEGDTPVEEYNRSDSLLMLDQLGLFG